MSPKGESEKERESEFSRKKAKKKYGNTDKNVNQTLSGLSHRIDKRPEVFEFNAIVTVLFV